MKNLLILITTLTAINSIYSQENYSLGLSFGLGKTFFNNSYQTDEQHFQFKNPTSIFIGAQLVKPLNTTNHLIFQVGYTIKKIAFEYNTNEASIPYNFTDNLKKKFDCISIAIGYRKFVPISKLKTFFGVDIVADYNNNVSFNLSGTGNSIDNVEIPLETDITYQSASIYNIGEKSFTFGSNIGVGLLFGEKKNFELSANILIPFNKIQNKTSSYNYKWQYNGNEYNHNLDYRGGIFLPNLKFTYYVFNK